MGSRCFLKADLLKPNQNNWRGWWLFFFKAGFHGWKKNYGWSYSYWSAGTSVFHMVNTQIASGNWLQRNLKINGLDVPYREKVIWNHKIQLQMPYHLYKSFYQTHFWCQILCCEESQNHQKQLPSPSLTVAPENREFSKGRPHLPTIHFQGRKW